MTSPPKFGLSARFCSVRIGTIASGRIDRDAAAVSMRQGHDVVDIGVFRQQLGLDALDRKLQRAGDALHAGRDRQHVLGADRTVGVAKTFERVAFERRLRGRDGGGEFERCRVRAASACGCAPRRPIRRPGSALPRCRSPRCSARIGAPSAISDSATLWPCGTKARSVRPAGKAEPAGSPRSLTTIATLSRGLSLM